MLYLNEINYASRSGSKYLTLTRVVFELKKIKKYLHGARDLTLTSVVF